MINNKRYILPETNYYKKEYIKTQIVIGHTGRTGMKHFDGWVNRRNNKYKSTANFTVDTDGEIYEHFNPKYYSDFIGVEQDKSNISITMVNIGWLEYNIIDNSYIDWLGHIYSKDTPIIERQWRDHKYWSVYTEKQTNSLRDLVIKICDDFNIEKKCIGNCVYNEDVDIFNGVTFRSNYQQQITDVSPAFNMDILKEL